jgi:hypothetical protein
MIGWFILDVIINQQGLFEHNLNYITNSATSHDLRVLTPSTQPLFETMFHHFHPPGMQKDKDPVILPRCVKVISFDNRFNHMGARSFGRGPQIKGEICQWPGFYIVLYTYHLVI